MSGKRKAKKTSEYKTSEQRSVFLYGYPNKEKREALMQIQTSYNRAVNTYIRLIMDEGDRFLLQLLKRDRKNSELRAFEKANRVCYLTSALSQSAFDYAVDLLATRAKEIKAYVWEYAPSIFSSSMVLFYAVVQGKDRDFMISEVQKVIDGINERDEKARKAGKNPKQGKTDYYEGLIETLTSMEDEEFISRTNEVLDLYYEASLIHKVPEVKKAQVRLTSMLFSFQKSEDIKAPYVIGITDPENRGKRIPVPLNTSANAIRRLEQYGAKHSVDYTVREDGMLKVTVAFEKKHKPVTIKAYRGADVGITEAIHTSDDKAYGSFLSCIDFYDANVLPALGDLNSIRNKKRKIKHFLRRHPALPADVKQKLRDKIDRLETMLRKEQKSDHLLNRYHAIQEKEIKDTVDAYMESLSGDRTTVTVLERLDTHKFNKSKKMNRELSMFARGTLTDKLIATLNWNGYPYVQVEPAYTSQSCPICSYTDKKNRDGKRFACHCCGYADDADHVGALNIKARAEDSEIQSLEHKGKLLHDEILVILKQRNEGWKRNNKKTEAC